MTGINESIHDQVVGASHISSLEKYKFLVDNEGLVTVRTTSKGTYTPTGLRTAFRVTTLTINGTTETALPPVPLTGRNSFILQNKSNNMIYVDNTGVSSSGWEVAPYAYLALDITDDIILYAISEGPDVIVKLLELA